MKLNHPPDATHVLIRQNTPKAYVKSPTSAPVVFGQCVTNLESVRVDCRPPERMPAVPNNRCFTVGCKKLEQGCRMIFAGCPCVFGLGLEDGHVSFFLWGDGLLFVPPCRHTLVFSGGIGSYKEPAATSLAADGHVSTFCLLLYIIRETLHCSDPR